MLVCRWASVNDMVQNKFSIIHLLSHHEVCWKLTIKTPEQSHWRHSGIFSLNSKHISHYALVFLVSIADFEQAKSRLGSKSHHCKTPWYCFFVACQKHLFMVVRGKLRNCVTSKMVLFCENSLQFEAVNNFGKRLHFKICYGVLNLAWVFFRFTFIMDLFSSPNIFKY